jgi:hypothetical protein
MDKVVEVVAPLALPNNDMGKWRNTDFAAAFFAWNEQCLLLAKSVYGSESVPEAYWRTLCMDSSFSYLLRGRESGPESDLDYSYRALIGYRNGYLRLLEFCEKIRHMPPQEITSTWNLTEEKVGNYANFVGGLQAIYGRPFFSTRDGRIGLGPSRLAKGDEVCVFHSGGTPFILRYEDGNNVAKLIGESYVHGLMNAEALDMVDRGDVQKEDILLG